MQHGELNWIANYIWSIADDVLRDLYVRGKHRGVILPMTVLRRLDAALEDSKADVLKRRDRLDKAGVVEQEEPLRDSAISRAHRQIEWLQEYRVRLIADVGTGKLDVRWAVANLPGGIDKPESCDHGNVQSDGREDVRNGLDVAREITA